jgi:hypothetical protein
MLPAKIRSNRMLNNYHTLKMWIRERGKRSKMLCVKRSGRLDVNLALEIAAQVAAGSAAVHEPGRLLFSHLANQRTLG